MTASQLVPAVSLVNGRPGTTSLKIAESFEKSHDRVLKDIRSLIQNCPKDFTDVNFDASEYKDSTGRTLPMFIIYFDGFILLVMGYTGKKALQMKLAYIAAFNAMKEKLDKMAEEERARACATATSLPPTLRAELKALVDAKLSTQPASVQGKARSEIWTRFNRHFQIAEYAQLPQAKMPEARDYLIGLEVRALQALPPAPAPATPGPQEDNLPKAMPESRKEILKRINRLSIEARQGFSYARNLIQMNCHPGVLSMKMNYQEREIWHLLESLQQAADESLAAAYNAVSAGYRLGLLVGRE